MVMVVIVIIIVIVIIRPAGAPRAARAMARTEILVRRLAVGVPAYGHFS